MASLYRHSPTTLNVGVSSILSRNGQLSTMLVRLRSESNYSEIHWNRNMVNANTYYHYELYLLMIRWCQSQGSRQCCVGWGAARRLRGFSGCCWSWSTHPHCRVCCYWKMLSKKFIKSLYPMWLFIIMYFLQRQKQDSVALLGTNWLNKLVLKSAIPPKKYKYLIGKYLFIKYIF